MSGQTQTGPPLVKYPRTKTHYDCQGRFEVDTKGNKYQIPCKSYFTKERRATKHILDTGHMIGRVH